MNADKENARLVGHGSGFLVSDWTAAKENFAVNANECQCSISLVFFVADLLERRKLSEWKCVFGFVLKERPR